MKTLSVHPLRSALGDCTANGVTKRFDTLYLFEAKTLDSDIIDYAEKEEIELDQCIRVVERENPLYGSYAEVVFKKPGHYMAGGNFVYASDSRYKNVAGVNFPLSVHDRCEPWKN